MPPLDDLEKRSKVFGEWCAKRGNPIVYDPVLTAKLLQELTTSTGEDDVDARPWGGETPPLDDANGEDRGIEFDDAGGEDSEFDDAEGERIATWCWADDPIVYACAVGRELGDTDDGPPTTVEQVVSSNS